MPISTENQPDAINFTAEMFGNTPARENVFVGQRASSSDW
jgi:hypothetical protein